MRLGPRHLREAASNRPLERWKPRDYVTRWTRIAKQRRRTGFAVPFVNDFKGELRTLIPDELANLLPAPSERIA